MAQNNGALFENNSDRAGCLTAKQLLEILIVAFSRAASQANSHVCYGPVLL